MKHIVLLITTLLIALHGNAQQRGAWTRLTAPAKPMHLAAHGPDRGNAPANDDCANAEAITVAVDCTTPIAGNNADATNDGADASCDDPGADLLDVWYTFNSGPEDTVAVTLTPGPDMEDWAFALYDGCGGAEVACVIVPFAALNVAVSPNTDYWLRVYSNPTYGVGGAFTVCVTGPVVVAPPPANDECTGAVPQALAIGGTVTFQGDNTGATDTEALGQGSAWEAFTLAGSADITIDYCGTAPTFSEYFVVVFASCPLSGPVYPGSYDTTACGDGNGSMCFSGLPAGTYYYPVMAGASSTGPYVLNVTAEPLGTNAVSNDACTGAIPVMATTSCTPQIFSNGCASQSLPATDCGNGAGEANDDVWYSFMATSSDMSIGVLPSASGNMDPVIELFNGSCGSLVFLTCADAGAQNAPEDLQASGLTVGATYYFRVYDHRLQYSWIDPTYELCVVEGLGSGLGLAETPSSAGQAVIYPNPTDGVFTLLTNGSSSVAITVLDASGRSVLNTTRNANAGLVQVDATSLQPGAYVVRCTSGGVVANERLVIR
ncbi:MAG: T9SS type A sorting domain-containing protein [Flavobacteriales bacterium]|jgi:hypothetical protein|nr:T9SS type A sorting domain-containing protein [Flavobacteriales bacterium]